MSGRRFRLWSALVAGMVLLFAFRGFAGEWIQNPGYDPGLGVSNWRYQEDGTYFRDGWKWIDHRCYYFNEDGYMLEETSTPDGFRVDSSGAWVPGIFTDYPIAVSFGYRSDRGYAFADACYMDEQGQLDQIVHLMAEMKKIPVSSVVLRSGDSEPFVMQFRYGDGSRQEIAIAADYLLSDGQYYQIHPEDGERLRQMFYQHLREKVKERGYQTLPAGVVSDVHKSGDGLTSFNLNHFYRFDQGYASGTLYQVDCREAMLLVLCEGGHDTLYNGDEVEVVYLDDDQDGVYTAQAIFKLFCAQE